MRLTRIVLALVFAAFAVAAWAKYDAVSHPKLSFADRWAPVDEALYSGEFQQK
jgi:cytochrome c-type biogenesis protein CcmH/NrfG